MFHTIFLPFAMRLSCLSRPLVANPLCMWGETTQYGPLHGQKYSNKGSMNGLKEERKQNNTPNASKKRTNLKTFFFLFSSSLSVSQGEFVPWSSLPFTLYHLSHHKAAPDAQCPMPPWEPEGKRESISPSRHPSFPAHPPPRPVLIHNKRAGTKENSR